MIDFTNCELDLTSTYAGSDQKRAIIYDNKKYMLKFSDKIYSENKNDLNSSYSNSIFSEYICCHILNELGFKAQNTLLGFVKIKNKNNEIENKPVVACENFTTYNTKLIEFKDIASALLSEKPSKIPNINEIYDVLTTESPFFSKDFADKALKQYWDVFILDAFLGNFDRHANNWGYIVDVESKKIIDFAPIYDCGSCLYPQLADKAINEILNNPNEVEKRISKFPNAALTINNQKVNYKTYINSFENKDCTDALIRIFPKINLRKINNFINSMPEISNIRKTFYCTMLEERYVQILEPAYLQAIKLCEIKENKNICEQKEEDDICL